MACLRKIPMQERTTMACRSSFNCFCVLISASSATFGYYLLLKKEPAPELSEDLKHVLVRETKQCCGIPYKLMAKKICSLFIFLSLQPTQNGGKLGNLAYLWLRAGGALCRLWATFASSFLAKQPSLYPWQGNLWAIQNSLIPKSPHDLSTETSCENCGQHNDRWIPPTSAYGLVLTGEKIWVLLKCPLVWGALCRLMRCALKGAWPKRESSYWDEWAIAGRH